MLPLFDIILYIQDEEEQDRQDANDLSAYDVDSH